MFYISILDLKQKKKANKRPWFWQKVDTSHKKKKNKKTNISFN